MNPKEILQGNRIIAEFMGYKVYEKRYPRNHGIGGNSLDISKDCILEKLKYHSSWDLLMPVVEKISRDFDFSLSSVGMWACYISRKDSDYEDTISTYGGFDPMILNVWKSAVKFIEWYNLQPKYK